MNEKILLLDSRFKPICFITEKKAIKLIFNKKADVISKWNGLKINYINGCMDYPATVKLNYPIKIDITNLSFSRDLVFRRDKYKCSYCGERKKEKELTIDHVLPKKLGGKNSFENCVAACFRCNLKKGAKTLQDSGFVLKFKPEKPKQYLFPMPSSIHWHSEWFFFIDGSYFDL